MKTDNPGTRWPEDIPNLDNRVFGEEGEPDVFIARDFWRKLLFLLFSLAILVVAVWEIWGPFSRLLLGERAEARVVRVERDSPGEPTEVIRVRREIEEGDYALGTTFRHFVEVLDAEGNPQVVEMAVASRQTPYALVNDTFTVIYFSDGEYAYGLWHHRSWAFGLTLLLLAVTFVPLSWYLFHLVGKPIPIDPEDPGEIRKEQDILRKEREEASTGGAKDEEGDSPPPPPA